MLIVNFCLVYELISRLCVVWLILLVIVGRENKMHGTLIHISYRGPFWRRIYWNSLNQLLKAVPLPPGRFKGEKSANWIYVILGTNELRNEICGELSINESLIRMLHSSVVVNCLEFFFFKVQPKINRSKSVYKSLRDITSLLVTIFLFLVTLIL